MNKKLGFSLVEVMIIFVVMSAIVAAMMPSITMRSKSVPIKIARGAYICYMDDGGALHEEVFNRKHQIKAATVDACKFLPVKQAAAYQITVIGAGAGGYNHASLSNSIPNREVQFRMKKGYTGEGTSSGNYSWPYKAEMNEEMVGIIPDDLLWSYYNGQTLRLSMDVPEGGQGGSITADFQNYSDCSCSGGSDLNKPGLYDLRNVLYTSAVASEDGENYSWTPTRGSTQTMTKAEHDGFASLVRVATGGCSLMTQRCNHCEGTDKFSWGGEWKCSEQTLTAAGQKGGAHNGSNRQYLSKSYNLSNSSLTGFYNKGSRTYQALLKLFGERMLKGYCTQAGNGNSCNFKEVGDNEVAVRDGTTPATINIKSDQSICDFTGRPVEGNVCTARGGTSPTHRIAMKMPNHGNSNGFDLIFQTKISGAGDGARVKFYKECGRLLRYYNLVSDTNSSYEPEFTIGGSLSPSDPGSYRPMLKIITKLVTRNYVVGDPGGNGEVKVATKTFFEGDCDIKIGKPGKAHKGNQTPDYGHYINSGEGDTIIKCEDNKKFEVKARAGVPYLTTKSSQYVYTWEKRNEADNKSEVTPQNYTVPVALQLLRDHANNGSPIKSLDFGKGGSGPMFTDRCIKPKGTFEVNMLNEFTELLVEQKLKQNYVVEEDCYQDSERYATVMLNQIQSGTGDITSHYLDLKAARRGTPGAVIITW